MPMSAWVMLAGVAALAVSCPRPASALPIGGPNATEILSLRPFVPADQSLFSPVAYPNTPPLLPTQGSGLTEQQALQSLQSYLAVQFPGNTQAQNQGLAIFNSSIAQQKIPNPSLRAGLVGLKGTIGEPAIDFILNAKTPSGLPKVVAAGFGVSEEWVGDPAVARSAVQANQQQFFIFNPKYQAENPFLFTRIIAHEPLHQDAPVANNEEIVALALDSFIYLEQLALHPDLAITGTELARRSNTNALTRLNSGVGSELGLFASNGDQPILPGSPLTFTSWFEQFANLPNLTDTPGNALLGEFLALNQESGRPTCSSALFSFSLLQCIDLNSGALSPEELVLAASALRLTSVAEVPEPGTLLLLVLGLVGSAYVRRSRSPISRTSPQSQRIAIHTRARL